MLNLTGRPTLLHPLSRWSSPQSMVSDSGRCRQQLPRDHRRCSCCQIRRPGSTVCAAVERGCRASSAAACSPPATEAPSCRSEPAAAAPHLGSPPPSSQAPLALASALLPLLLLTPAAHALQLHGEPSNALSLPTWAIHVSSTVEWAVAIQLMWRYAEVTDRPQWKGMAWGMVPLFGSALCACTWHFFYNSTDLEFLVVLQAFLTVLGNFTCWLAAYRIYQASQPASASPP